MRFLIIDDSMPMRRIITNVLARLGFTDVVLAANGREALKRLEAESIDFVITDWFMPEMSGIDFLRAIREHEATKDVPILIVTANGSRTDVAQAVKLRVNGYVLKPFTAELLKERIAAICASLPPPRSRDEAARESEASRERALEVPSQPERADDRPQAASPAADDGGRHAPEPPDAAAREAGAAVAANA